MKGTISKTKIVFILATAMILAYAVSPSAMMSSGGMGGGSMMTSAGGFGMMGGMAGAPLVAPSGTAFFTSMMPSASPGTYPTSSSFVSHMSTVVPSSGQILNLSVSGVMSKPVFANGITVNGILGSYMISTVSLPNMSDYSVMHNYGTMTGQSVLFWMLRPFTTSSVLMAVSMDGSYASQPVIANNMIYITTTNNGSAMMQGNDVFNNTFPNYTASSSTSYLYVFNMDGTLVSKTQLQ